MTESATTRMPKWPFLISDACLLTLAGVIVHFSAKPLALWQIGLALAGVIAGAWICTMPFLREYHAAARLAEAGALSAALAQLRNLESIKNQISSATAQWDVAQDQSAKTVAAAKEIAQRMKAEVQEFCAFMERANESEKAHLRLEVEKLRRAEGEWLQVLVRILDHVYALNRAAAQSGQPGLISELGHFQHACRDAARRLGVAPLVPAYGAEFDAKVHELANGEAVVPPQTKIIHTIATGYSFRGQQIRRALVSIGPEPQPELPFQSRPESFPDEPEAAPDGEPAPAADLAEASVTTAS